MLSYLSKLVPTSPIGPPDSGPLNNLENMRPRNVTARQVLQAMEQVQNPFTDMPYCVGYRNLLHMRKGLPVYNKLEEFLRMFQSNAQVILLTGETGSGKSTQIPQFVAYSDLPFLAHKVVACTQPRRIAATSIAERVAKEMDVELGQEVGYSVRFEEVTEPGTTFLKYMTDGMLLREAMHDRNLSKYSVIILDESQERSYNTDLLMGLLKGILPRRPDLKVIIMSAVDNPQFRDYFSIPPTLCISVTGRTFPVDIIYYSQRKKESYNEAAIDTVLSIHLTEATGDILVFLTGAKEIEDMCRVLKDRVDRLIQEDPSSVGTLVCIPLYASLSSTEQERVFQPAPPPHHSFAPSSRKVVVATNIAETSLTIDGVVYVVDSGFEKSEMYDPATRVESLRTMHISQAAAQQRSGRAGRTSAGKCYRLYTEKEFRESFRRHTYPQILRCNLSTIVLMLKRVGVQDVLSFDFIDRPDPASVTRAMELLHALEALDVSGNITEHGTIMADLPMNPQLAKALIVSPSFGCSKELITISAMICVKNVWLRPSHLIREADEAKRSFLVAGGDHLTLLNVYKQYTEHNKWPWDNYLSSHALEEAEEIRVQLKEIMTQHTLPLVSSCTDERHLSENVRKALLSGFFTQVARRAPNGKGYRTLLEGEEVLLHPSCALIPEESKPELVLYNKIASTTRSFVQNISIIQPEWLSAHASTAAYGHAMASPVKNTIIRKPPKIAEDKEKKGTKGKSRISGRHASSKRL